MGLRHAPNNFAALRLVAAGLVVVAHSWALTGRGGGPTLGGDTLGGVGVAIFFAISGYLVCQSWVVDSRLPAFLAKRALRLLPALVVAVLISTFVVGPAFTSLPAGAYLSHGQTLGYVWNNSLLHVVYWLPGVFAHNPGGPAVNGSLWSLPVEVRAYALLAVLGLLRLLRTPIVPALVAAAFATLALPALAHSAAATFAGDLVSTSEGLRLTGIFFAASALFLVRDRIPLQGALAVPAAVAFVASAWLPVPVRVVVWTVCVPYLVVFAAFRSPGWLRRVERPGDASYGVYLYGHVVQQSILAVIPGAGPIAVLAMSAPLSYLAGLASWRLIEAPALRLKRRLPVRPAAIPAGAAAPEPAPATR
jgi:peptidoglycan/LPS O-acetylase OafA/YrhL